MKNINFKNILLDVAVCAMACDGNIDEREIEMLKNIEKDSPYFSVIDLSEKLKMSEEENVENHEKFQNNLFKTLKSTKLNIVEELTVIEISLRIIAADEIEEKSEIEFIKSLRACLDVEDYMLIERFGEIAYLKKEPSLFASSSILSTESVGENPSNKNLESQTSPVTSNKHQMTGKSMPRSESDDSDTLTAKAKWKKARVALFVFAAAHLIFEFIIGNTDKASIAVLVNFFITRWYIKNHIIAKNKEVDNYFVRGLLVSFIVFLARVVLGSIFFSLLL